MSFLQFNRGGALLASALGAGMLLGAPAMAEQIADNHVEDAQMGEDMGTQSAGEMTIVDIASQQDSLSTLVQALQSAGLADTLASEGPYTVFAPSDDAFAMLPEGALDFLLQPENQDLLQRVLTYHVVPQEVTSNQLSTGKVESLSGGLAVRVSDSGVVVNNASVTAADVQASNGVVHVVNRVLLPEPLQQELASRLGLEDIY